MALFSRHATSTKESEGYVVRGSANLFQVNPEDQERNTQVTLFGGNLFSFCSTSHKFSPLCVSTPFSFVLNLPL